jgi:putative transcriptional regulator
MNEVHSYAGFLLGAHPGLLDPNFSQSVVLLSAHSSGDGALGVIINRPTGETLGSVREGLTTPLLQNLPLYQGGPVGHEEVLLVAWKWDLSQQNFRLFFGMEPEKLDEIVRGDPSIEARAFLGYAGWSAGQLEAEVERSDWAISPFRQPLGKLSPQTLWRNVIVDVRPEWSVLMDAPDDPSVN